MKFSVIFSAALFAAANSVKIMPLGDSITGSPGCWRAYLWQSLNNAGLIRSKSIDFVGTLPTQGCGFSYDGNNEGHGGYLVKNVANQNMLPGWLSSTRPDIVLMHFGTNDVWNNVPTSEILNAYTKLLGQMRASNPRMKLFVAQIIPMKPSSCACNSRVTSLNSAIPGWASSHSTSQSPIYVVNQNSGFPSPGEQIDGVHPNDAGFRRMAAKWYIALQGRL